MHKRSGDAENESVSPLNFFHQNLLKSVGADAENVFVRFGEIE